MTKDNIILVPYVSNAGVSSSFSPSLSLSQVGDSRRVLHALRSLLEELRAELREEAQRCCQLQQTLANERAAWEIQRAEMRSRIAQVMTPQNYDKHQDHTHEYELTI